MRNTQYAQSKTKLKNEQINRIRINDDRNYGLIFKEQQIQKKKQQTKLPAMHDNWT